MGKGSIFINDKGSVGFINSDKVVYRKTIATIVEKQVTPDGYWIKFTYPDGINSNQGILLISQKEFNAVKAGDKMQIFYGVHFPHLRIPIKSVKMYFISMFLLIPTLVRFAIGAAQFYTFYKDIRGAR